MSCPRQNSETLRAAWAFGGMAQAGGTSAPQCQTRDFPFCTPIQKLSRELELTLHGSDGEGVEILRSQDPQAEAGNGCRQQEIDDLLKDQEGFDKWMLLKMSIGAFSRLLPNSLVIFRR